MAQLAADDFNRSSATDLGANWGQNGVYKFRIVAANNQAGPFDTSQDCVGSYTAFTPWPNDQYSEVTIGTTVNPNLGGGSGPAVRCGTTGTTTAQHTCYRLCCGTAGWGLMKVVANAYTGLDEQSTPTFAAGDVVRLQVVGSSLTCYKNGVLFKTHTDATLTTGRPGVAYSSSGDGFLNAWAGGSVGSPRMALLGVG